MANIIATDEQDGKTVFVLLDDGTFRQNGGALQPANAATLARAASLLTDQNRTTLEARIDAALAANDAFLALANPTPAQVAAFCRTLAKENSGLIRLLRNRLDTVAGT